MALADYNRKRNFRITAEPPGRLGATASGHSFVIQKHAASRLHYDFRLELDGVLRSWSIPKGPSFDPNIKRLAVAVEDHPIDYGGFEGIIPAGQYGGGTVLLWDRGTWNPLTPAAEALATGHMKFELTGEKLRGRWVLVRVKERPGRRGGGGGGRLGPEDRSWLLIKERDEYARPEAELNVTEARPESVVSGRDLPAIAADSDRVWHSNRGRPDPAGLAGARRAAAPESFPPMGAVRARAVPKGDAWLHEIEIAGERVVCRVEDGKARLLGADGRDRTSALETLSRAVLAVPVHDAVFDGVATALGPDGVSRADVRADTLYLFDVPFLDGHDLRRVPLHQRKSLLETLIGANGAGSGGGGRGLRYTDHVAGQGAETFAAATQLGVLGVVSKRAAGLYRSGAAASGGWRVVRCPTVSAANAEKNPAARRDKAGRAKSVGAVPPSAAKGGARDLGGAMSGDVRIAGVKLTHPDRLLYPEVGVTKRELATFYERVAPLMLPHVVDRPLTLVRAPDGMKGASFYVRRPGLSTPPELRRAEIPEGTGSGPTMIIDDVAALVALAQMNVMEIHTWNARVADIERPDRLVFDLDPGPRVTWNAVVEGALHVRAALQLLDLEAFVKTTGSKGLHVVVPLAPSADWTDSLEFTRTVAQAISRAEPRRYTAALPKAGREDKILIDYLRNRRGATSVSVFSARARPAASVSVPVAWEDLGPRCQSGTFKVRDLDDWLAASAKPWAGYGRVRQKLTRARIQQAQALAGRL